MEKIIVVRGNEKEIEIPVVASLGALIKYRSEFTSDLLQDLNEIFTRLHPDPIMDAIKKAGIHPEEMSQEELASVIMANVDYSLFRDEGTMLPDGDTYIKAMQIVWIMAKTAIGSTKRFDLWCEDMGLLPVTDLVDRCHEIWQQANAGTIEIKN